MLDPLEEIALEIRAQAVHSEHMFTAEGLAMIVCPTPDVHRASLMMARERLEEKRRLRKNRRRSVSIDEVLAGF